MVRTSTQSTSSIYPFPFPAVAHPSQLPSKSFLCHQSYYTFPLPLIPSCKSLLICSLGSLQICRASPRPPSPSTRPYKSRRESALLLSGCSRAPYLSPREVIQGSSRVLESFNLRETSRKKRDAHMTKWGRNWEESKGLEMLRGAQRVGLGDEGERIYGGLGRCVG